MNERLLEKVLACPRLPSMPAIAAEVIDLCRRDDVSIDQIARTISNDAALTTKILKTVNSAYYGLAKPVSSVSRALVILGLNGVKTLALGFTLVDQYRQVGDKHFDMEILWRRSLYAAVGARSLAQHIGHHEPEEAFLAGLLQDLGIVALIQTLGDEYLTLLEQTRGQLDRLPPLERDHFGLDHAQVGEALARHYKLPAVLTEPIRCHEQPDKASADARGITHCVALGATTADLYLRDTTSRSLLERYYRHCRKWLSIDQTAASKLLATINDGTEELARLFEINISAARQTNELLDEAKEVLLELSLESQRSADQLAQQNQHLKQRATTDPLTGVANRGHFNEFLTEHFGLASRAGEPISLILIDIDRFKSINDSYGHPTGDRILISLAELMQRHTPQGALAARYGGEEFAIVLPATDRPAAARLADQIRCAIEGTPIELDSGRALSITASMGVACYDGARFFRGPQQLLKAADRAVYAAKDAGRNCVRVFTPKPSPVAQQDATPESHRSASPARTSGAGS